jgi:outer membrane protein OmpA-like peptidoglycan-associated protein
VDVPERGPHLVELTLPPETGRVRVRVVGPDGAPVPAMVAVDGGAATQAGPEGLEVELGPGTHGLAVRAEGFASQRADAVVAADQVAEVVVRLAPARVALTREKIVILEKVFFDTAKDTIRPESFALLDEVAATLRDRPDMERVRIEGHTDERGPAGGNLDLSERRAASVRRYLVERGIDEARLTSRGFGESKPLDAAHTAAAWDKNRRVEFVIEAWAATP